MTNIAFHSPQHIQKATPDNGSIMIRSMSTDSPSSAQQGQAKHFADGSSRSTINGSHHPRVSKKAGSRSHRRSSNDSDCGSIRSTGSADKATNERRRNLVEMRRRCGDGPSTEPASSARQPAQDALDRHSHKLVSPRVVSLNTRMSTLTVKNQQQRLRRLSLEEDSMEFCVSEHSLADDQMQHPTILSCHRPFPSTDNSNSNHSATASLSSTGTSLSDATTINNNSTSSSSRRVLLSCLRRSNDRWSSGSLDDSCSDFNGSGHSFAVPCVSFRLDNVETHPIPHVRNMPHDQIASLWYTRHDYDQIRSDITATVQMLREGRLEKDDVCYRGLEYKKQGQKRTRFMLDAFDAVFRVQDQMRYEHDVGMAMSGMAQRIAKAYIAKNRTCRMEAYKMGVWDAKTVEAMGRRDTLPSHGTDGAAATSSAAKFVTTRAGSTSNNNATTMDTAPRIPRRTWAKGA